VLFGSFDDLAHDEGDCGNGRIRLAEIHWYEAHGIGKKEFKRKRYLD